MKTQSVPHNDRRSRKRSKRPQIPRVVEPPKIRVLIAGEAGYGGRWADAHLVIRRGCYRYMRWRVGRKVQEFYLGKLENRTTQKDRVARRRRPAPRTALSGTKSAFRTFVCRWCPLLFADDLSLAVHLWEQHKEEFSRELEKMGAKK